MSVRLTFRDLDAAKVLDVSFRSICIEVDRHDVDANALEVQLVGFAIADGGLPHAPEFRRYKRFGGHVRRAAPGPDLDEDDVFAVFRDQVDLNSADADVSVDDAKTLRLKPMGGDPLAEIPEPPSRRHHLNAYWATGA